MSDIDCNSDMRAYHGQRVTLTTDDRKKMRERRDTGRSRLKNGLRRDEHPEPYDLATQGSYAMHTMHQDDDDDYDIDDGAYFKEDELPSSPKASRERIAKALADKRFNRTAQVKANCVRQVYAEGFHIDVPVYRTIEIGTADNPVQRHELASGDEWVESDARSVTRWFSDKRSAFKRRYPEDGGAQFARVVRLTKQFARSRKAWKSKTTSGICITKLVTNHFNYCSDRLDKALRETWRSIEASLVKSTQIDHPVYEGKSLSGPNDAEVRFFADKLAEALETLTGLDDAVCTQDDARALWDLTFVTDFFSNRPGSDEGGSGKSENKTPFTVVAPAIVTEREDPGRYG